MFTFAAATFYWICFSPGSFFTAPLPTFRSFGSTCELFCFSFSALASTSAVARMSSLTYTSCSWSSSSAVELPSTVFRIVIAFKACVISSFSFAKASSVRNSVLSAAALSDWL